MQTMLLIIFRILKLTVEWQFLQTPIYEHPLIFVLILKIYQPHIIMNHLAKITLF